MGLIRRNEEDVLSWCRALRGVCGPDNLVAVTTSDITVKKSNGLLSGGGTGLSLLMEG